MEKNSYSHAPSMFMLGKQIGGEGMSQFIPTELHISALE
uniref:Uncharacterized protein n=1 Tax=Oryza sativa subsp. japonica TaxID=39947 RepID=Q33A28_ORYSJ|nr:hypothetical protein LOC_Os10g16589 [Oryza sativa Japonica Group]